MMILQIRLRNTFRRRFECALIWLIALVVHFMDFANRVSLKIANEPGYVGPMVEGFHDTLLAWVKDGLSAYSDDTDVMDSAFFLVSRTGNYDTFLNEEDIPLMESAAQKEISPETSPGREDHAHVFCPNEN